MADHKEEMVSSIQSALQEHQEVTAVEFSNFSDDELATLFSILPARLVSKILPMVTRNRYKDIVMRMTTVSSSDPAILCRLRDYLNETLTTVDGSVSVRKPVEHIAEILRLMPSVESKAILNDLMNSDVDAERNMQLTLYSHRRSIQSNTERSRGYSLARDIRRAQFRLDDLALLSDKDTRAILRVVNTDCIVKLLFGASPAVRARLLSGVDKGAYNIIMGEVVRIGKIRRLEFTDAVDEFWVVLDMMSTSGQIYLPNTESEDDAFLEYTSAVGEANVAPAVKEIQTERKRGTNPRKPVSMGIEKPFKHSVASKKRRGNGFLVKGIGNIISKKWGAA